MNEEMIRKDLNYFRTIQLKLFFYLVLFFESCTSMDYPKHVHLWYILIVYFSNSATTSPELIMKKKERKNTKIVNKNFTLEIFPQSINCSNSNKTWKDPTHGECHSVGEHRVYNRQHCTFYGPTIAYLIRYEMLHIIFM